MLSFQSFTLVCLLCRARTRAHSKNADELKENWRAADFCCVHWDGKMMISLDSKYKLEDRLPVIVSGGGDSKLLGIPVIPKRTSDVKPGSITGESVYDCLVEWKCLPNVIAMVCDTTASNTGMYQEICFPFPSGLWFDQAIY